MKYHFNNSELNELLEKAQNDLFKSERHKFQKDKSWRNLLIPNTPGVYALFEDMTTLLYIGETGNLRERMNEINRTVNHSFRKQLGHSKFGGVKSGKKYDNLVEKQLDKFFLDKLHVSFIEVNFGRLEIETFIITNHQKTILNSEKKRKLKIEIEQSEIN